MHATAQMDVQGIMLSEIKANLKGYIEHGSTYIRFYKWQNYGDGE